MDTKITYKPFGNNAILIEWESIISEEILIDILSFQHKIEKEKNGVYQDFIIGYNSLTILYTNEISNYAEEVKSFKLLYKKSVTLEKATTFLWEIPVCYDLEFGIDLKELSITSKLEITEIIKLHTQQLYTVFFIGFLPGFLYLGGLDEQIHFSRKANPRLEVKKGSVAIGGKQTGIYPFKTPGGWNIIGNTPINFFNIEHSIPCFAKAGDKIEFVSVTKKEFEVISKQVAEHTYQFSKTKLNA